MAFDSNSTIETLRDAEGRLIGDRDEQARRESEAKARAIAKLRAELQAKTDAGKASQTGVGQAAVRGHLGPLTDAIKWAQENRKSVAAFAPEASPAGRPASYADILSQLPANVAALLALKETLDVALKPHGDVQQAARSLGAALEREAMVREFNRLESKFIAECAEGFKKRGIPDDTAAEQLLIQMREKASVEWNPWDAKERRLLALDLVAAAVAHSNLFEFEVVKEFLGKTKRGLPRLRSRTLLKMTPAGVEWWQKSAAALELHAFECAPMVCRPIPWRGAWGGGYVSPETPPSPLAKTCARD